MAGQHRRIYDFSNYPNLSEPWMWDMRQFATFVSRHVACAADILNQLFGSMLGKKAERNPYNANTLEWVAQVLQVRQL